MCPKQVLSRYTTSMGNLETLAIDLNKQLEAARHAYYVLAAPIITDAEYDVLEAQLTGLVAANPSLAPLATALTSVGNDAVKTGTGRIKHLRPMLSIENQYKKEDVVAFFLELQPKKG